MQHIRKFPAALSAIALALAAVSARAQVVNGGFDGLAGWTVGGDAVSVGGDHLVLTTASSTYQDDYDANGVALVRNLSGNDPLQAGSATNSLEAFVGLPLGALDPDTAGFIDAFEGSAATQTFTAASGSHLSFTWDLSTLDQRDPTQADYAFVVIDGGLHILGDAFAADVAITNGDYAAHTGSMSFTTALGAGASHTIAFGVVDVGDASFTSALSVSGVNVSAVPEAPTLALMGAGLGLLALMQRRRRGR